MLSLLCISSPMKAKLIMIALISRSTRIGDWATCLAKIWIIWMIAVRMTWNWILLMPGIMTTPAIEAGKLAWADLPFWKAPELPMMIGITILMVCSTNRASTVLAFGWMSILMAFTMWKISKDSMAGTRRRTGLVMRMATGAPTPI